MAQCQTCNSPADVVDGKLVYHTNTYDLRVCPASGEVVGGSAPAAKKAPAKKAAARKK
jgi:hypothetical protein